VTIDFLAAVVTAVNRLPSMPRILIITSLKLMSAANIFRKKIRAVKKSKQLVLLSLTCNIMAAEQRRRNRSCWTHEWIGRRPELGFTTTHSSLGTGKRRRCRIPHYVSDGLINSFRGAAADGKAVDRETRHSDEKQ